MIWKEAINFYKIHEMYHEASFKNLFNKKYAKLGEDWVKSPTKFGNLFISGGVGRGKTFFIISLLRGLVEFYHDKNKELDARFMKSKYIFDSFLKEAHLNFTNEDLMNKFSENKFLFIDDAGTEKYSERIEGEWFTLIDNRTSTKKITIISSNLSMKEFGSRYKERIDSRMNYFHEIEFLNNDRRSE